MVALDCSGTHYTLEHLSSISTSTDLKNLTLLYAIIQALSLTKEDEDAFTRIGQTLDSIDYQQSTSNSRLPVIRPQEQANGSFYHHNQSTCIASEPLLNDASGPKLLNDSNKLYPEIPSELITSCVATLFMIQVIQTCYNTPTLPPYHVFIMSFNFKRRLSSHAFVPLPRLENTSLICLHSLTYFANQN